MITIPDSSGLRIADTYDEAIDFAMEHAKTFSLNVEFLVYKMHDGKFLVGSGQAFAHSRCDASFNRGRCIWHKIFGPDKIPRDALISYID